MRFRNVLVIAGILITWSFVTYYFLLRNIKEFHLNKYQHRQKQLQQLEKEVTQLLSKGDRLMEHFLAFLKLQYQQQSHNIKRSYVSPTVSIVAGSSSAILSLMQPPAVEEQSQLLGKALGSPKSRISKKTKSYSQSTVQIYLNNGQAVIPILVLACNRVSVIKCLDNLMQYRPNAKLFPIIVSQDCGDEATKKVILSYGQQLTLIEHPDLREIVVPPKERKFKGYYKIARHYGWALNYTFALGYEFAVIVEDDLNISPDFYEYFLGAHMLLKQDPTLWCVSAWNDNGKAKMIDSSHPELLYRTDFFPGLGWMLTKDLWQELSIKWPKSFWDDWIRHPEQRKSRACIRPEMSRTRTFGKVGVSNGLFFDKYLRYIKLSEEFVPFTKMNLSYLLKENYDKTFLKKVYNLPIVTYDELRRNLINQSGPVRIQYNNREQYKRITKMLGLMDDFKSGVPRTAYHGIVSFFYEKRRVFLAPNVNWKGYDLSWS